MLHAVSSGVPLHLIQPWLGQAPSKTFHVPNGGGKIRLYKINAAALGADLDAVEGRLPEYHTEILPRVLPYCFHFPKWNKREREELAQNIDFI